MVVVAVEEAATEVQLAEEPWAFACVAEAVSPAGSAGCSAAHASAEDYYSGPPAAAAATEHIEAVS